MWIYISIPRAPSWRNFVLLVLIFIASDNGDGCDRTRDFFNNSLEFQSPSRRFSDYHRRVFKMFQVYHTR
jgi:hypothetical protein